MKISQNIAEQLTSSDFGVSTGLIYQGYWEASKWYFVNVERGNVADKITTSKHKHLIQQKFLLGKK